MIGRTISHYRILEKLGEGGMGVVYQAEDTHLHRTVVLKFITSLDAADRAAAVRFIHEAQAGASLNHPNIATIYEYDEFDDPATDERRSFIAMEYVEGETLRDLIAQGSLTEKRITDILVQTARGLQHAHLHGVIHRDIKPANIICTRDGRVKILDFGLAKLIGKSSISESGNIMGTVAYMSPEQIAGGKVDNRSDVWSLGIILFEMFTQKYPFKGDHPTAIMYSITNAEPANISEICPGVTEGLQTLYNRCLRKDPAMRPQTMGEILETLGEEAPPSDRKVRTTAGITRRRKAAAILSGIVLLVLLGWLITSTLIVSPSRLIAKGRLAILPFSNLTDHSRIAGWSPIIQTLFAQELTGVRGLGIVDPASLNGLMSNVLGQDYSRQDADLSKVINAAGLTLYVNGGITESTGGFTVLARLVTSGNGEILFSRSAQCQDESELPGAVRSLSREILNYYQGEVLRGGIDEDLRPWVTEAYRDVGALKAFIQAGENILRGESGLPHLLRAVELDSTFISPRVWLISMLVQRGEMPEAIRHYGVLKRLEASANPFEAAMIQWAHAFITQDMPAQEQSLQRAREYSAGNNIILYNLGYVRFMLEDYAGAIEATERVIDMRWKFSPVYHLAAMSHFRIGNRDAARMLSENSLAIKPVDPGHYSLLAMISLNGNDTTRARDYEDLYLAGWKQFGLSESEIHAGLGDEYFGENFTERAGFSYGNAIALDPENPGYHSRMGDVHARTENIPGAIREYLRSLELDAGRYEDHFRLGQMYDQMEDSVNALRHYREYLRTDSTSERARTIQERLPK